MKEQGASWADIHQLLKEDLPQLMKIVQPYSAGRFANLLPLSCFAKNGYALGGQKTSVTFAKYAAWSGFSQPQEPMVALSEQESATNLPSVESAPQPPVHNFFEALFIRGASVAVVAPIAVFTAYPFQMLTVHYMRSGANGSMSFSQKARLEYPVKECAEKTQSVMRQAPWQMVKKSLFSSEKTAILAKSYHDVSVATVNSVGSKLAFLLPWKMGQYLGDQYNYPILAPMVGFAFSTELQIQVNFAATMRVFHSNHDPKSKEATMPLSEFNTKKFLPQKRAWRIYNGLANFVTIGAFELTLYSAPFLFPNLEDWHEVMAGASVIPANLLLIHAFKATTKTLLRQPCPLNYAFFFGKSIVAAGMYRTLWRGTENGIATGASKRVEKELSQAYDRVSAPLTLGSN